MHSEPRPQIAAQLQFHDGASCRQWLASLPLTNVPSAQLALTEQIALARQAEIAPLELLRALEALREPAVYVQHELSRKFTARPLPLESGEAALWTRTQELWQELLDGYLACRDRLVQGDSGLTNHGALIMMRCLRYQSCAMFGNYRVYREVPAAQWKKLHQLYDFAEQSGYAYMMVADTFNRREADSSCTATYCGALLAQLANPFALSGRQMEFLVLWIEKWSGLVGLSSEPQPPSAIPALAVNLAGSAGPVIGAGCEPLPSQRYIDFEQIGRTVRQMIALLKEGQTPAQLGLGKDARQPGCESLLMLLYIQWCRAGTGRGEQRNPKGEKAQVCLGIHAAHFYLTGRAFRAPGSGLTRQEQHDLQMFGHVGERTLRMLASNESSAIETWELVNQSSSGFMCLLRETNVQMRVGHNQLVAVRRGASKRFYLGLVQWLRVEENHDLFAGVRLFPGIARAVAARPANFNAPSGIKGYDRALLLHEAPAPASRATLILPTGWFQPGRFVEIHEDQKQVAKLVTLLEKGSDFERCTVALV